MIEGKRRFEGEVVIIIFNAAVAAIVDSQIFPKRYRGERVASIVAIGGRGVGNVIFYEAVGLVLKQCGG